MDKELKEGRSKTSTPDQHTLGHLLPEPKALAQEAHARAACDCITWQRDLNQMRSLRLPSEDPRIDRPLYMKGQIRPPERT